MIMIMMNTMIMIIMMMVMMMVMIFNVKMMTACLWMVFRLEHDAELAGRHVDPLADLLVDLHLCHIQI